jgi:hypothetical protein
MQPNSFSKRHLTAITLMLDEEEKNAAESEKRNRMWVQVFQKQKIKKRIVDPVQRVS